MHSNAGREASMVVDAFVDLVDFLCVRCDHGWTERYDVLQARGTDGVEHEYFGVRGIGMPSPYRAGAAPACPRCTWPVIGRLVSRRSLEGSEVVRRRRERGPNDRP
jgi:hypothetical protein